MQSNHQIVVSDAADLSAESGFWAAVLGDTVDAEDDWHMVSVELEVLQNGQHAWTNKEVPLSCET